MGDTLTVPIIAIFDHFKGQNTHFILCSTVFTISGNVFIPYPRQKVGSDMFKYFLGIKIGFSWMGDALTLTTIANFDHFKGQNTHFTH